MWPTAPLPAARAWGLLRTKEAQLPSCLQRLGTRTRSIGTWGWGLAAFSIEEIAERTQRFQAIHEVLDSQHDVMAWLPSQSLAPGVPVSASCPWDPVPSRGS